MEQIPTTKIYETIRTLGIVKHKKRQEFICSFVEGLIKSRSVIFSEIADKIDTAAEVSSVERRIQNFFQKVNIDYFQLGILLLGFVHHDKLLLSIDRTEWDFGGTQINILCVVASIGKMAVPLHFEMLDNNSGNSNWQDRISSLRELIKLVGRQRIALIVMDREFVGHQWLLWLKKQEIDFCVRVPKNHKITLLNGECCFAEELLKGRKSYYAENVVVDKLVVNLSVTYGKDGEFLYLIGSLPKHKLCAFYKKRWTIEVFFQALKSRGFNIEKSCLKNLEKYKKLFALVSLAYTICWATGVEDGKQNPVRCKKHGYPKYSIFRRGLNLMRKYYKNKILAPVMFAVENAINRIFLNLKTVG